MMRQRNPGTLSIFSFGTEFGHLNVEMREKLKGGLTQGKQK